MDLFGGWELLLDAFACPGGGFDFSVKVYPGGGNYDA